MPDFVPKEDATGRRESLLDAFVANHFDPQAGAPLCSGGQFRQVAKRLGRGDLPFDAEATALGTLTPAELKAVERNFDERKRAHDKSLGRRSPAGDGRQSEGPRFQSPYFARLSTEHKLVFNALDVAGTGVIDAAVATTLAQGLLQGWFDIGGLKLAPVDLLQQAVTQNDPHAAYLLSGLVSDDRERQKLLDFAVRVGHRGAVDERQSREAFEDMRDDVDASWYASERVQEANSVIERAKRRRQGASGDKLAALAEDVADAARTVFWHSGKVTENEFSAYEEHIALAVAWATEAAPMSARAKHWLATDRFPMRSEISRDERLRLLREAADGWQGVAPNRDAQLDLIEELLDPSRVRAASTEESRRRLEVALQQFPTPKPREAVRLADAVLRIFDAGTWLLRADDLYELAAHDSPYAAFRTGLASCRRASSPEEYEEARQLFELSQRTQDKHVSPFDEAARQWSEIALQIGWTDDDDGEGWDIAAIGIARLALEPQSSAEPPPGGWLTEEDIDDLVTKSPSHRQRQARLESLEERLAERGLAGDTEKLQTRLDQFAERHSLVIGSNEPRLFLRGVLTALHFDAPPNLLAEKYLRDAERGLASFVLAHALLRHERTPAGRTEAKRLLGTSHDRVREFLSQPASQGFGTIPLILDWLNDRIRQDQFKCAPKTEHLAITRELDGPVQQWGTKLLAKILELTTGRKIPGKARATSLRYEDPYVNRPIDISMLAGWVRALRDHLEPAGRWAIREFEISPPKLKNKFGGDPQGKFPTPLHYKWTIFTTDSRNAVLEALMKQRSDIGVRYQESGSRRDGADVHDRIFVLGFDDGSELRVAFGKGPGYWTVRSGQRFHGGAFVGDNLAPAIHGLSNWNGVVEGQFEPTNIWVGMDFTH